MSLILKSTHEMAISIAQKARIKRLSLNLSQKTLSQQSGVSHGTLKKFEQSGDISLASLLKIALSLDEFEIFESLFTNKSKTLPSSLDQLLLEEEREKKLKGINRKRGRK